MEGNEMEKRVLKVFLMLFVFCCVLLSSVDVQAEISNNSVSEFNSQSSSYNEILREDLNNKSGSNLVKINDADEDIFIEQIKDSVMNDDIERTTSESFWEVEPNNTFENADYFGEFGYGYSQNYLFGTIGNSTTDIDIYSFTAYTTGELNIYGFWMGDYYGFGYEEDLIIGLYDSVGNLVRISQLVGSYGNYASNLNFTNIPRNETWYIAVIADTSMYQYLYNYQDYALSVEYDQTSKPISMELYKLPDKTSFLYGEPLSTMGGEYSVTYNDGSYGWNYLLPEMVTGYNPYPETYGLQELVVTYGNVWTTYIVSVDRFIDVPYGHRNYVHINALVDLGIINGYSDNTFKPNNTLTRAQAAIMIVRAAGISTEGVSSSFTDVSPTHAAYKFISAAYQAGIINGYSDGTFKPNAFVTRAQIAIMVQRAFNVQASETVVSFIDVPEGYAPKKFIEILASQKIVNGYSDGTFKPLNNVTRAQFSTMIYNAIQYAHK
jgi:hypothetical protein